MKLKHNPGTRSVRAAVRHSLLAASLLAVAGPSLAADDVAGLDEVIVTGSRIRNPNLESPSPVQVVTSEDIQSSGILNLQELLLTNPAFGTPLISRTNSNFQTSGVGVATVDLRNLGVDRTLTLVDGRRYVSGLPGSSAVDYNTIPAQFIERVDILTGGASSVYGSDAVAGVVNIIYKKDFEGVAFDGQYGISEEGDNEETQVGLTFGANTADGRGNVMAHLGYSNQEAVFSRDRARSDVDQLSCIYVSCDDLDDIFVASRPTYSSYAPQGRFFGDSGSLTYDEAGNLVPWSAARGFNRSAFRTIAVPVERYLFASRGSYEYIENHSAFFEGTYAASSAVSELEPFPFDTESLYPATGGQMPIEFDVDGTMVRNPFVPNAIYNSTSDNDGDGARDIFFSKRLSDVGARGSVANRDTFRLVGGVEGGIGDTTWGYEGYYVYGQTKEAQTSGGQFNVMNFRSALEAIPDADDVDGDGNTTEAICRDPIARAQGCVPNNPYGFNSMSPESVAYIVAPGSLLTMVTQKVTGANFSGEVFDLPAGPLSMAVGGEYREESSDSEFDALSQAGLNGGNKQPATRGSFDVLEGYVELSVPILADMPFADSLSFNGAIRASDYSTVGNTLSWNAGLEWAPIPEVRFRVTRALSTRAPNINELYAPPQETFPTGLADPCQGVTATSSGAYDAACRADPGVAANIAANGAMTLTLADIQGIGGFDRGNPNLSEEEGNSWTAGVVITPTGFMENFNFTIDYYRIEIDDAIVQTPRQFILNQCYSGIDTSLCDFITRRPTAQGPNNAGSIDELDAGVSNSGGEFAEGVDLTVGYSANLGPGTLSARLAYTFVIDQYVIPLPGADKDVLVNEIGAAESRASLSLGWSQGRFGSTVRVNYIGSSDLDDQFQISELGVDPGTYGVSSKTYVDGQITFAPAETWQLYLGINNLFDTSPPPIISPLPGNTTGAETDSGTYDAIGRRYYAGVRVKF